MTTQHPRSPACVTAGCTPRAEADGAVASAADRDGLRPLPRDGDERFRKLFAEGPLGMAVTGLDHRFAEVNAAFCRMLGRTEAELVGLRFADVTHPHDVAESERAAGELSAGRAPSYQFKKRYLHKGGGVVLVRANISVIRDAAGDPQYFLGMFEDVSEAQRADDRLRESERRYRRLIETAEEGIWTIDALGKTTFANAKLGALLGYDPAEMVGRHLFEFVRDEDRAAAAHHIERRRQGINEQIDFRFRHKDGADVWTMLATNGMFAEDGRYTGALAMVTDVTARRRMEDETRRARDAAEAANRTKDEFLATLSHELRTPASAILIWANLLKRGGLDAEQTAAVDVILQSAREQARLVDDLLDASRILYGKVHAEVRPMALAEVVRAAVGALRPGGADKGVRLRLAACADAPVLGDPALLKRVVYNLVSNAIKFTPEGGRVTISLRRRAGDACLRVVDTGEGFGPEFLPRLFEPFTQADSSSTRRHGGLGLGLSLARSILDLHGGSVAAHSDGPGRGAAFTVTLPLLAELAIAPGRPTTADHQGADTAADEQPRRVRQTAG